MEKEERQKQQNSYLLLKKLWTDEMAQWTHQPKEEKEIVVINQNNLVTDCYGVWWKRQ